MAFLNRFARPVFAAAILVSASVTLAQSSPREMALGKAFDGKVTKALPDCFQLDIPKGEKVVASLKGANFPHMLRVMRGAQCDADVAQFEEEGGSGKKTDIPFTSVGGRYLVVVHATSGGGGYELAVNKAEALKAEVAETPSGNSATAVADAAAAGLPPEATAGLDLGNAPPPEPEKPVDPKVALMKKQLLAYNIQKAEDEARAAEQRRIEAERRQREEEERQERMEQERQARREREEANSQMWGAILQGVQQVAQTYVDTKNEQFAQQQRLNQIAAENQRRAAEQRAETLRQQQQAANDQKAAQNAAIARQLAQANATRDQMIARTTDPRVKAQLEAYNQQALAIARQRGIENEMRQQSSQVTGQVVPGASAQQVAQQAQAQRQAEAAKREETARLQQEAQAKREADALKAREDAQRRQEQMLKQQEAQRKAQEEMRKTQQRNAWMNQRASGGMSTVGLGGPVEKGATPPGSGELSRSITHIGGCAATNIRVRYNLSAMMGEALVNGAWLWNGDSSCTPPHNTVIWLRIQAGSAYGYVQLNPPVMQAGSSYAGNISESPAWSRLICGFSGSGPTSCMSDPQARSLWANGQVVGFEIGW